MDRCGALTDPLQHRPAELRVHCQSLPWKARQTKLRSETQPVGVAQTLADQRQAGFAECVPSNQVVAVLRQRQQRFRFEGGQDDWRGMIAPTGGGGTIRYPPDQQKTSLGNVSASRRFNGDALAPVSMARCDHHSAHAGWSKPSLTSLAHDFFCFLTPRQALRFPTACSIIKSLKQPSCLTFTYNRILFAYGLPDRNCAGCDLFELLPC